MDIFAYLKNEKRPIYGAMLEGENIYKTNLSKEAVLILGNEANGISNSIQKLISKHITIPQFGETKKTESLNVASSAAIILSEFKR
jgi:TrmH family RNA methyltransferase